MLITSQTPIACPRCGDPAAHYLTATSQRAVVDYFRCDHCGHVWTEPKAGQTGERQDITVHQDTPT
jgi:uncharacterized Zn finger protein